MDDELLELSSSTVAALQEFYTERDFQEKRFEDLKAQTEQEQGATHGPLSMDTFSEDWNASQFWYSNETATLLARELLEGTTGQSRIAIISAPSVFIQLKNLLASGLHATPHISLLEFDKRFNVFKEFVHYDFHYPLKLPLELKGTFDRIICDPPFLSSDCQTKAAMTARWLSKVHQPQSEDDNMRVIVCTGERMEELILKLYCRIHTTTFEPKHAQDRLSNDFRCYANYQSEAWTWTSTKASGDS